MFSKLTFVLTHAFVTLLTSGPLNELLFPIAPNLFQLCLEASNHKLTGASYTKEYINSELFLEFLNHLNNSLGRNFSHHDWTDWRSWEHHYVERANRERRFNHNHPVCSAAAFSYVPFRVQKGEVHHQINLKKYHNKANYSLKLLTVESFDESPLVVYLKRTACLQNIPVFVIKDNSTQGFSASKKALLFAAHIKKLYDSTPVIARQYSIVLFVDAHDAIIQLNPSSIIERFLEMNHSIIFSAEHTCFPLKYFPWNLNLGQWLGTCPKACSNNRYICDHLFPDPPESVQDRENKCKFCFICALIN